MSLTDSQKTIMQAALHGLPMDRFSYQKGKGDPYGTYAAYSDEDRRVMEEARHKNWNLYSEVVVFNQPSTPTYTRRYIFGQNSNGSWIAINKEAQWPPNQYVLALLKNNLKPYSDPTENNALFSDRNMGILGVGSGLVAWLVFGSWGFWWNVIPAFLLIAGIWHLYKRYLKLPRAQRMRIINTSMAMLDEGITFGSLQDSEKIVELKSRA